jgi:hypothetical protein
VHSTGILTSAEHAQIERGLGEEGVGNKERGNDDLGGNKISGGLNANRGVVVIEAGRSDW